MRVMAPAVWGMTQHRDPGSCLFLQFSPDPPTPESPQASLVHSALPLPEPRLSGCKQNVVCWPFKRLSASPAASPWPTEPPATFHRWMLSGFLSCSSTVGWQAHLGVQALHFSGGSPQLLKYPPELQLPPVGSPASPLMPSLHSLPVPGEVVSSVCLWL